MHSLQTIRRKLATVRSAVRALYVVDGVLRLAVAILALLLLSFVFDRLIMFPWAMRACVLLLMLGVAAGAAYRFVVYAARVPITVDDVAAEVERTNPFLKDRLITALQLDRHLEDPEYADSAMLTRAVIREAEELAGGIKFFSILQPQPVILLALGALLSIGGTVFSATQYPTPVKVWALRNIALADLEWPSENEVHLVRRTFRHGPQQPLEVRFLLEQDFDASAELRVLELASSGVDGEGTDGRSVPVSHAVRVVADASGAVPDARPGELVYRETIVPLKAGTHAGASALTATLEPSANPRWFFVRAEHVHSGALVELRTERVLSPMYALEPTQAKDTDGMTIDVPQPDRDIYVPRGHTLKLEAIVFGPVVGAEVHYRLGDDTTERSAPMTHLDRENRYVFEDFNEVREQIAFRLGAGDAVPAGEPYTVRVRVPPGVMGHRVEATYPSYLGRTADPAQATGRDFLNTPLGTRLSVRLTADFATPRVERGRKAPKDPFVAILRFDNESLTEIRLDQLGEPTPVEGLPDRVRVEFGGEFVAVQDTSFYFVLRGPNRLTNENPQYFQLTVVDDRAPDVALERPSRGTYKASRDAAIRFVLEAADDHGLRRVLIRYRLDGEDAYRERVLKEATHDFKAEYAAGAAPTNEPKKKRFEFVWELDKIGELKAGREVLFHLMVEDYALYSRGLEGELITRTHGQRIYRYVNNSDTAPNAERAEYSLKIVSKLEIEKEINDQLQSLREIVRKLRKEAREVHAATESYAKNERYTPEDLDQIFKLELRQSDITREIDSSVRQPLIAIQELYRENHLTPATNVGEMIRLSSRIFLTTSPKASKKLKDAQAFSDPAKQRTLLGEALVETKAVIDDLDAMLKEMAKFVDFSEVIRSAQSLLNKQKRIEDETKSLLKKR